MTGKLSGQRAVVTGAANGIGRAIAERFGEMGADVAMLDVDEDNLEGAAASVDAETLTYVCDVRETDVVDRVIDETVETWDGIDIVVNNAGILVGKELVETTDAEMDRVVDVNLKGAIRVSRAAIPALRASQGAIINMSSIQAAEGAPKRSVYASTKGGISSLTRQLAAELAPDVRVNAIAPGTITTPIIESRLQNDDYVDRKRSKVPLNRLGTTEDIARAAVFLASEDANYVNGHVLAVDGGRANT